MSTHGLINEVSDHQTYCQVNGEWTSFLYTEPISRHNHAKHWVDDVNNCRHAPIGLEDVGGLNSGQIKNSLSSAQLQSQMRHTLAVRVEKNQQSHSSNFGANWRNACWRIIWMNKEHLPPPQWDSWRGIGLHWPRSMFWWLGRRSPGLGIPKKNLVESEVKIPQNSMFRPVNLNVGLIVHVMRPWQCVNHAGRSIKQHVTYVLVAL